MGFKYQLGKCCGCGKKTKCDSDITPALYNSGGIMRLIDHYKEHEDGIYPCYFVVCGSQTIDGIARFDPANDIHDLDYDENSFDTEEEYNYQLKKLYGRYFNPYIIRCLSGKPNYDYILEKFYLDNIYVDQPLQNFAEYEPFETIDYYWWKHFYSDDSFKLRRFDITVAPNPSLRYQINTLTELQHKSITHKETYKDDEQNVYSALNLKFEKFHYGDEFFSQSIDVNIDDEIEECRFSDQPYIFIPSMHIPLKDHYKPGGMTYPCLKNNTVTKSGKVSLEPIETTLEYSLKKDVHERGFDGSTPSYGTDEEKKENYILDSSTGRIKEKATVKVAFPPLTYTAKLGRPQTFLALSFDPPHLNLQEPKFQIPYINKLVKITGKEEEVEYSELVFDVLIPLEYYVGYNALNLEVDGQTIHEYKLYKTTERYQTQTTPGYALFIFKDFLSGYASDDIHIKAIPNLTEAFIDVYNNITNLCYSVSNDELRLVLDTVDPLINSGRTQDANYGNSYEIEVKVQCAGGIERVSRSYDNVLVSNPTPQANPKFIHNSNVNAPLPNSDYFSSVITGTLHIDNLNITKAMYGIINSTFLIELKTNDTQPLHQFDIIEGGDVYHYYGTDPKAAHFATSNPRIYYPSMYFFKLPKSISFESTGRNIVNNSDAYIRSNVRRINPNNIGVTKEIIEYANEQLLLKPIEGEEKFTITPGALTHDTSFSYYDAEKYLQLDGKKVYEAKFAEPLHKNEEEDEEDEEEEEDKQDDKSKE